MVDFRLVFDKSIPELEKKNLWTTAVDITYSQWLNNTRDLNCLLCAGTEIWYAFLLLDNATADNAQLENIESLSMLQLKDKLMHITYYGLQNFFDNSLFNAYFGYMISVMPYFFLDNKGDYLSWESRGIEMIRSSFLQNPSNLLAHALCCGLDEIGIDSPYYNVCAKIWNQYTPEQWGDSEVQQYFFRVLYGDSFCPNAFL